MFCPGAVSRLEHCGREFLSTRMYDPTGSLFANSVAFEGFSSGNAPGGASALEGTATYRTITSWLI